MQSVRTKMPNTANVPRPLALRAPDYGRMAAAIYNSAPASFPVSLRSAVPGGFGNPSVVVVRSYSRYLANLSPAATESSSIALSCNPSSHAQLTYWRSSVFAGSDHLYPGTNPNQHTYSWVNAPKATITGGAVLPIGGINPFTVTGYATEAEARVQFLGASLHLEIVTNYMGMAEIYFAGSDSAPRTVGRHVHASHGTGVELSSATASIQIYNDHVFTIDDFSTALPPSLIGGSSKVHVVLPFPAAHHMYMNVDNQTPGQSNPDLLHTGQLLACFRQGMGGVHVRGLSGTTIVSAYLVAEHAVSVDNDSILLGAASATSRGVEDTDKHVGGFGGIGNTKKDAMMDSVRQSTAHAVKKGALTATERNVIVNKLDKHDPTITSAAGVTLATSADAPTFLQKVLLAGEDLVKVGKVAITALEIGQAFAAAL